MDPAYRLFVDPKPLGSNGNFDEVDKVTMYHRWKMTTKPYGDIAHKHYLRWVSNLPKGPSVEALRAVDQTTNVRKLWDDIRFERLEKNEADRQKEEKELREKEDRVSRGLFRPEDGIETKRNRYLRLVAEGKFTELRDLPTKADLAEHDMSEWSKGYHPDYDVISLGFPPVSIAADTAATGKVKVSIK